MRTRRRRGFGLPEAIAIVLLVIVVALIVLMALPRYRETSRVLGCERNLMRVGVALGFYAQANGQFPGVPELPDANHPRSPGPLEALLMEAGQADFSQLNDPGKPPARLAVVPRGARFLPGLVCPADLAVQGPHSAAPVSYRATAGDDTVGGNGPFAPGKLVTLSDINSGDGSSYTAAFAERLVGSGRNGVPGARDYARVPGSIGAGGCPTAPPASWRGDGGSDWTEAGWRSSLYTHTLRPNEVPSCIAADGRSARMGASSEHLRGVNVLLLDGSVRPFTPKMDANVWRRWATVNESASRRP